MSSVPSDDKLEAIRLADASLGGGPDTYPRAVWYMAYNAGRASMQRELEDEREQHQELREQYSTKSEALILAEARIAALEAQDINRVSDRRQQLRALAAEEPNYHYRALLNWVATRIFNTEAKAPREAEQNHTDNRALNAALDAAGKAG